MPRASDNANGIRKVLSSSGIVQYESEEGLANASITFKVRSREDGAWQTQAPLTSASDGSFSFTYEGAEPPEVQLIVTLPEPWQLWGTENIEPWVYETDTNSFTLALADKHEATLELTAAAVRQFKGQVALSTASDGANSVGIAGATVQLQTCTQVADPTTCSSTGMTETTDAEGYFKLIHPSSSADPLAYRLVPVPPAGYATQLMTMTIPTTSDFTWDPNASGLLSTQALVPGEFVELNMVLQLQSITISASDDRLTLGPDEATWRGSDYPNPGEANDSEPSYYVYITTVPASDLPTVSATWEVYLPVGEYYVEVWIPEGMSTHVNYSVVPDLNSAGAFAPIQGVWSYQNRRDGNWFNFKVDGFLPLTITSTGEIVTIKAIPTKTTDDDGVEYPFADTMMAIGPIRFVVGVP